ncbi:MAG: methylated-DNA--[protein]-cysteine S-methyltransferase [Rikenellaceae bacterium]
MDNKECYTVYATQFGDISVGYKGDVVTSIKFINLDNSSCNNSSPLTDCAIEQIREYFDGRRRQFTFEWELRGTEFQKRVWRALCDIPYGERRTYKDIAVAVGSPSASRAVGAACNHNPMLIVVPCHRVVGSSGRMVGYAGGVALKEKLLRMESANVLAAL